MPPIHILQRLFHLIHVLLNHQEFQHHREQFIHFNEDVIQEMDNMLTTMERYHIRGIFRQTMAGKLAKANTRFPRCLNEFCIA